MRMDNCGGYAIFINDAVTIIKIYKYIVVTSYSSWCYWDHE